MNKLKGVSQEEKKITIQKIIEIFDLVYGDAKCSLDCQDPLQLLISTQLAAQCTDVRVNIVIKTLFLKYKTASDFANAITSELEKEIMSTGFFRNKARNIINCCKMIIDVYGGEVPDKMNELLKLPGVGRKTANLVLGDAFDIPGIVIDTHAKRLSFRLGLTLSTNPDIIERDLMKVVPVEKWTSFCHQLVFHGRASCTARKPDCLKCPISAYCTYFKVNCNIYTVNEYIESEL